MTPFERMHRIEAQLSHVWMVRTFLKHSDEAADDEEVKEIHRVLYDYALAVGKPYAEHDADAYLKQALKKLSKLQNCTRQFVSIQPDVSQHTNFQMAARSLQTAVTEIEQLLRPAELASTPADS